MTSTESTPTFAECGVRADIAQALADQGITTPFPIQALTLPVALSGQDIIGQAKTGTGKTLGFGLPALQTLILPSDQAYQQLAEPGAPQALIIVPTRELAIQVGNDLALAAAHSGARISTLYGGRPYESQVKELAEGRELIVGTPGRLIDLYQQKYLSLANIRLVVLDEADEMLDLGFLPDVERILAALPAKRQTMLFSATMPGAVLTMARRYMKQPMHIRAESGQEETLTKASIRQIIYRAHPLDKDELVGRILRAQDRGRTVIFTKTKRSAAKVAEELTSRGFAAGALHGDLNQAAREQALRAFRKGKVDILVATDVAARGIDVEDVTHVINYQCPEDEKTYLHRVGRTGRAGKEGTAVTLVDWEDVPRWKLINQALELGVLEPVETYSSSPHLFKDLGIAPGTKGRLPKEEQTAAGLAAEEAEDFETRSSSRSNSRSSSRAKSGSRSNSRSKDRPHSSARARSRSGSRSASRGQAGSQSGSEAKAPSAAQAESASDSPVRGSGRKRRSPASQEGGQEASRPRRRRRRIQPKEES